MAKIEALPRATDGYTGPLTARVPSPSSEGLAARINVLLPGLLTDVEAALEARLGRPHQLRAVEFSMVKYSGLRDALQQQERCGTVMGTLLAWALPITYDPNGGKVMVAAATARHFSDDALRFHLARAFTMGTIGQEHRNFYDGINRLLSVHEPYPNDLYACRATAHALSLSVAFSVTDGEDQGPWWQRVALFILWPFAQLTIGPMRLARRLVPVLEKAARSHSGLVDRMFQHPSLCRALTDPAGLQNTVTYEQPGYGQGELYADLERLRIYNPNGGAVTYSPEA